LKRGIQAQQIPILTWKEEYAGGCLPVDNRVSGTKVKERARVKNRNRQSAVVFNFSLAVWLSAALMPWPASAQTAYRQPNAGEYIKILDDPHRIEHLKPLEIIRTIGLKPGYAVADIGSGSGLFTRPMAEAVAPGGMVYAVDIDKDLLSHVKKTAEAEGISNITAVLAPEDSPSLPAESLDVAFICDTLHHIAKRQTYLTNLKPCFKPGGRLVIIDFSDGWPAGHEPLRFSLEDLDSWTTAAGYRKTAEFDTIEGNFFRVYEVRPNQ
jgi:arsenite methyltransferase